MKYTIYTGGNIITMTEEKIEAVCTADGVIEYTGRLEEAKKLFPNAEIRDLEGNTLIPSFIDSHSHITVLANTLATVPLSGCTCFEEIRTRMCDALKERGGDSWLLGFGYDHNALKEKRHPDTHLLDEISRDVPIMVTHTSGHMGSVNTKALEIMGLTADVKDMDGGRYGRYEDGNLNGYREEKAFIEAGTFVPPVTEEDYFKCLDKAQKVYASYGITTVQDGMTGKKEIATLKKYADDGRLYLDTVAYMDIKTLGKEAKDYIKPVAPHLRAGGVKMFLDGSPQGKTAWLRKPYEGEKEYSGYPIYKDEEVTELCRTAKEIGAQIITHCNGDKAAEQYLNALEKAEYPENLRPVMIHAQLLAEDQLDKIKNLGVIPSFFVAHVYHWGDTHIENFGMERAQNISCAGSALKKGITFTFHQDTPVIMPDMIETIWCAVNRKTKGGVTLGENQKIPVYEALKAVTKNAAYQYFEEKDKGTIEKGKKADLVILSGNILEYSDIRSISVLETIKEGKTIYRR